MLTVTNGDVALAALEATFPDRRDHVLPWRDMLHDGPVTGALPLEAVSEIRAAFISAELNLPLPDVRQQFIARDEAFRGALGNGGVEIWLEHDLYDQLQLVQILAAAADSAKLPRLRLVQADTYIGALEQDALRDLAERTVDLEPEAIDAMRRVWQAVGAADPRGLAAFADTGLARFPHLAPALRRLLAELPSPSTGLSLTESWILELLAERPRTPNELFREVSAREEAMFLADLPFFRRLDGLAFAKTPLVAGLPFPSTRPPRGLANALEAYAVTEIAITDAGLEALTGGFDHAAGNAIDRWVGGTRVRAGNLWRYDRETRQVLPPLAA